jgi:predicted dithiol-disulfide oxidoreductase (DUF899 family)
MEKPEVVAADEWQQARDQLLEKEKAATRALDALAAARRRLPMVEFDHAYAFDTPAGPKTLADLFDGRTQLVIYQFMDNGPDDYCSGCSTFIDNVGNLSHLYARDTSFVVVSNMPLEQITAFRRRMGWMVPFVSSHGTDFTADSGTHDSFGLSVFLRDGDHVYRTYSTSSRGVDRLRFDFNLLDLTPFGRQETWEVSPNGWPQTEPYSWWRLHDEYEPTVG